jgi:hypothetical protein
MTTASPTDEYPWMDDVARWADGFSYQDMGPVTLKGVAVPMRVFRAAR